ncbi:MAG: hypothetical protein RQ729_02270 [Wenzhouxiangellaceae bacterium]|nr:hypothetical protein [Wenzhouxiangellaceae bacterium]
MKPRRPLAALVLSVATLVLLAACGQPVPAEQQILDRLVAMTTALESGDIDDFMAPVADDFIAGNAGLDRRSLGLLARRERLARSAIRVRRMATEVELIGDERATASFQALATGGSGWLPDEGRLWQVDTGWRRDGGDWVLISAEWSPLVGR